MKNIMKILVLGALVAFSVPAAAQDFNSTSSMPGSGSAYSSQVTPVGAQTPEIMASTTYGEQAAPHRGGARKSFDTPDDPNRSADAPIGSVWALLVFAAVGGAVVLRRRKGQTE